MEYLPFMSSHRVINRDTFAILVALSERAQTGRQVQARVVGHTCGMHIRDSVIYSTLHRLVDLGWANEINGGFVLSERGRQVLKFEVSTYESLLEQYRKRER